MPFPLRNVFSLLLLAALFLLSSCVPAPPPLGGGGAQAADPIADLLDAALLTGEDGTPLEAMGYAVQVGAFTSVDNAVRLERLLNGKGIDAYYFRHESGLYKVRFGNHKTYRLARAEAEGLRSQGMIDDYFIVIPEDYAAARIRKSRQGDLRAELVETARRFIGVPYRWGGTDRDAGFDCSGLTMVCYRLNGLNLPRVSGSQFQAGRPVAKDRLRQGDLIFFATSGGRKVSHVGLYIGGGKFIHAPRTGKTVRIADLSTPFFARAYLGGRSYL